MKSDFPFSDWYCLSFSLLERWIQYPSEQPTRIISHYIHDLYSIWSTLPSKYHKYRLVWYPHDRVERFSCPVLVKSRECPLSSSSPTSVSPMWGSILMKWNQSRHFLDMETWFQKDPFSWKEKKPIVFWRGAPTGYGFGNNIPYRPSSREQLIRQWALSNDPSIDVGLTMTKKQRELYHSFEIYEKPHLSKQDMMQYKYLLSVEGNDVATNLKWMMGTNSLILMPKPMIQSWFLEDRLEPWVHYLPVQDDFSDLKDKLQWAESHQDECQEMIQQSHEYCRPFLEKEQEAEMQRRLLKWYFDHVEWT